MREVEEGQKESAKRSEREREEKKRRGKKGRRASRASCHLRRTGGSLAYYATESVPLSSLFLSLSLPLLLSVPSRSRPTAKVSSPSADSLR